MAMISLDRILFEVYNLGLRLEDFMAPNQHLPERQYPCRDCKQEFSSSQEFSDHFQREGFNITGCKTLIGTGRLATIDNKTN